MIPRKLAAFWRRKLAESGFSDIEGPHEWLRSEAAAAPEEIMRRRNEAEYLHCGYFRTKRDRLIWSAHVDGATTRDIAATLGISKSTVSLSLRRSTQNMVGKMGNVGKMTRSQIRRTVARMDIEDVFAVLTRVVAR